MKRSIWVMTMRMNSPAWSVSIQAGGRPPILLDSVEIAMFFAAFRMRHFVSERDLQAESVFNNAQCGRDYA